jgi:hypothetical protein
MLFVPLQVRGWGLPLPHLQPRILDQGGGRKDQQSKIILRTTTHAQHKDLFDARTLVNRQVRSTDILCTAQASHTATTRFHGRMSG